MYCSTQWSCKDECTVKFSITQPQRAYRGEMGEYKRSFEALKMRVIDGRIFNRKIPYPLINNTRKLKFDSDATTRFLFLFASRGFVTDENHLHSKSSEKLNEKYELQ